MVQDTLSIKLLQKIADGMDMIINISFWQAILKLSIKGEQVIR